MGAGLARSGQGKEGRGEEEGGERTDKGNCPLWGGRIWTEGNRCVGLGNG